MNPETIDKIKEALIPVAEKIGQGAEYVWEVVVRQQAIEGIAFLVGSLLCFAAAIAGIHLAKRAWKMPRVKKYSWDDGNAVGDMAGFLIAIGITLQIAWIVGAILLTNGILHLLSPEFYAIEFFINLVSNNPVN